MTMVGVQCNYFIQWVEKVEKKKIVVENIHVRNYMNLTTSTIFEPQ